MWERENGSSWVIVVQVWTSAICSCLCATRLSDFSINPSRVSVSYYVDYYAQSANAKFQSLWFFSWWWAASARNSGWSSPMRRNSPEQDVDSNFHNLIGVCWVWLLMHRCNGLECKWCVWVSLKRSTRNQTDDMGMIADRKIPSWSSTIEREDWSMESTEHIIAR